MRPEVVVKPGRFAADSSRPFTVLDGETQNLNGGAPLTEREDNHSATVPHSISEHGALLVPERAASTKITAVGRAFLAPSPASGTKDTPAGFRAVSGRRMRVQARMHN